MNPLAERDMQPSRRRRLISALGGLLVLSLAGRALALAPAAMVEVWKDPDCGCCKDWIAHLRMNGFRVKAHESGNADARRRLGMPARFGSCHTARVGRYVIEGHVPADDIRRLLEVQPAGIGLAVPGMPVGSPGMDGPEYNGRRDPYQVLLVKPDGTASVFRSYR